MAYNGVLTVNILSDNFACPKEVLMDHRFIFYGSLMDPDLFYQISGMRPKSREYGLVYGNLYEVTDHTEPMGIHKYPILICGGENNVVVCVQITLESTKSQLDDIRMRLDEFEGDLYKPRLVEFISFNGKRSMGYMYVSATDELPEKSNIKKLLPISGVYLWKL
ncbi:gamma-glutamylcyclotransferase [Patescibacteria group bacterium]|nr:gamma-glutamylcyclotransferase [Patescibacteria group bacterium]MBU4453437.1 gamma-glutamylcyclotransferase [Patescibacteria group bacterium]